MEKSKRVLVHDDGTCANGRRNTILISGNCPVCNLVPDTQSTAFRLACPHDNVLLDDSGKCSVCQHTFEPPAEG